MSLITNFSDAYGELRLRKRAEEALRDSQRFIQRVAEAIPGIVYIYDLTEARNIYINHQVSQILGYTPEEIQAFGSQIMLKLVHPDDFVNIVAAHQQFPTLLDGEVRELEYRMRHASGEWRWLLSRDTIFLKNPDGSPKQILGTAQDITKRHQTEQALQEAQQELEIRVQKRTNELSNAISLLRLANSQLQQELVQRKQAEEALQKANSELEKYVIELANINEELQVTLEELARSQQQVQKQNQELVVTQQIVERERQRYQELFNFAPDAYLLTNLEGTIHEANQAAATLLHVSQKQLVGKLLSAFVTQRNFTAFGITLSQLVQLQRVQNWEVQLQGRRGLPFVAAITVASVLDREGKSVGLRWLIRDISDRKQAEETIKQQAEWERLLGTIANHIRQSLDLDRILTTTVTELQQLLQADRVLVFRLCPDGVGRTIAEAVAPGQPTIKEQQFPDEIFPQECYDFYRQGNVRIVPEIEKDEVASCLIEYFVELGVKSKLVVPLLQETSVWGVLSVHYCMESPRQWREWEIALLKRLGSQVAIAIQQAELYQQVEKALAQEKELNELKSRFVSMASHEFRTPLSTILSSADLLEYYVQERSTEKTLEHIQRIQAACVNMTRLLNDILVIGKSEAGKVEFNPTPLDLVEFCGDLVEEMQLMRDSKYTLTFVSQAQPIPACIDEKLLRHILTNLLSNAIKYSPKGSNVEVKLGCEDGAAIFQIQDEGIGIPTEDQPHLFESFHRAKNVGTIPGTGLGLAIVKRSVDLHGGQIAIASEVGVGTTVTVTLPLNSSGQTDEEDSGN